MSPGSGRVNCPAALLASWPDSFSRTLINLLDHGVAWGFARLPLSSTLFEPLMPATKLHVSFN
jgi:hypothetical protein